MDRGYIKLWRKIQDESWYTQPLTCHLAVHLILKANHKDKKFIWNRKEITVNRGQLVTGRDILSRETGLSHRNIRTSLEILKNCDFLTIKSTNKFSIITICNYGKYQDKNLETDQQTDQQTTSKRPASDHKQECIKKEKNGKNTTLSSKDDSTKGVPFAEIISYLNTVTGKHFAATSKEARKHINARWAENFSLDDFKRVIDIKAAQWLHDPAMNKFLRPETLFSPKFEGYLNETADIKPDEDPEDRAARENTERLMKQIREGEHE